MAWESKGRKLRSSTKFISNIALSTTFLFGAFLYAKAKPARSLYSCRFREFYLKYSLHLPYAYIILRYMHNAYNKPTPFNMNYLVDCRSFGRKYLPVNRIFRNLKNHIKPKLSNFPAFGNQNPNGWNNAK